MYATFVSISKEDFNEYLIQDAPKVIKKFVNSCSDEDFIECYCIKLPNDRNTGYLYDELWLVDCCVENGGMIPLVVQNINTSSPYAFWECGIYPDIDEDDEDSVNPELNVDGVKELVNDEYVKVVDKILRTIYKLE